VAAASAERARILERLRAEIVAEFPQLKNVVTVHNDALRFQGDGFFAKNRFELREDKVQIIARLAEKLGETWAATRSESKRYSPKIVTAAFP